MATVLKSSAIREEARVDRCHRCNGLMVRERVFEIGSFDWRCVSCGERIDPVILAHREGHHPSSLAREEGRKCFAGENKARLN